MTHVWKTRGLRLRYWSPDEFDHPEKVDRDLLIHLEALRHGCGFPLYISSDVRSDADMARIYGPDWKSSAPDSPHQIRRDGFGHAVDLQLEPKGERKLSKQTFGRRRLILVHEATELWRSGHWPRIGLEVATAHVHVDNDTKLLRPWIWPGVSR